MWHDTGATVSGLAEKKSCCDLQHLYKNDLAVAPRHVALLLLLLHLLHLLLLLLLM